MRQGQTKHELKGRMTMGTKGIEIVGMDVQQLLSLLNKAFADEWLAYYQYWLGAKVVKGPMKEANSCNTRRMNFGMPTWSQGVLSSLAVRR